MATHVTLRRPQPVASLPMFALLLALTAPVSAPCAETVAETVVPREIAAGVWLVPGGMRKDRQPDGNTAVFAGRSGLIVVDTGRHAWHRDAIVELARDRQQPIVAIINTHWHLDHVSGNPALRQAFPQLRVFASNAIDGALAGFLAQSARESAAYLQDESIPASMREDIAADAATVANGQALRPDVVIDRSRARDVAGRRMELHVAHDAVTAGDVWLYDPRSKIAVLGDLVTLPAPFLDTACPQGWLEALRDVEHSEFRTAIPGHGAPMSRGQVAAYREALAAFVDCAASQATAEQCSARWAQDVGPMLPTDGSEAKRAQGLASYYVDLLRANAGHSPHCAAEAKPATH